MFNFFKRLLGKKNDDQQANTQIGRKQNDIVSNTTFQTAINTGYSEDVATKDYILVKEISDKVKLINRYRLIGDNLSDLLIDVIPFQFKKTDLTAFLKSAEDYVNSENTNLKNLQQKCHDLQASIYALDDIIRMQNLMSEASNNIGKLNSALLGVKKQLENLEDSNDVLQIIPQFNTAFDYLKGISYSLKFSYDRIDFLVDKESEHESLRFYSKQYSNFQTVYNGVFDKLTSLEEQQTSLNKKLDSYTKRIQNETTKGLINLDLDGKRRNLLIKMRQELTEGYKKLENSCALIIRNINPILENLITSNSELSDYLLTLTPKLKNNAEQVTPKLALLNDLYNKQKAELDTKTTDLKQLVKLLNNLYE